MNIRGLKSGAVLQRDKNGFCKVYLEYDGELKTSLGNLEKRGDVYVLTGIKTGGPYGIVMTGNGESQAFENVYVGDVWLLGGQSNMEGAGICTAQDEYDRTHPVSEIRAFFMGDEWGEAVPLLHRLWKSKDKCISEPWINYRRNSPWTSAEKDKEEFYYERFRGVGPGFAFVKKMYEITGVPQAVIPCAVGGSFMSQWDPDIKEGENLYTAMIRTFREAGANVRGLYWDQGESECGYASSEKYIGVMQRFVERLREDTGVADLPCVFDQIAWTTLCGIEAISMQKTWTIIREKQRLLPDFITNCDVVSTINANLSDLIHKDSNSQREIGKAAAISMAALCGLGGTPAIRLKGFKIVQNGICPFRYDLEVWFDNVIGDLKSNGVPRGFTVCEPLQETPFFTPYIAIQNVEITGNHAVIHTEYGKEQLEKCSVYYGIGQSAVCTISDSENRYLPAFGPIAIKDKTID